MAIHPSDTTRAHSGYDPAELKKQVEVVEREWWYTENVADDLPKLTWTFEDASAQHAGGVETWTSEAVEGSPQETFDRIFRRFRVQANKKYRHPFKPALNFDIIRDPGARAEANDEPGEDALKPLPIAFHDASKYTGQQILDLFGGSTTLTYVRHDDRDGEEHATGPLSLHPWDRELPPWCTAPSHWLAPALPPGFADEQTGLKEIPKDQQYNWRAVPTLAFAGSGNHILPSATTPLLITTHVFVVAGDRPSTCAFQDPDFDHVFKKHKRAPTALTTRDVRGQLLGCWIQTSTDPLEPRGDERPAKRTRKQASSKRLGIAWGYEPSTRRLYCVTPANEEFVVDLSVKASEASSSDGAERPEVVYCEWIGPVGVRAEGEPAGSKRDTSDFGYGNYSAWQDKFLDEIDKLGEGDHLKNSYRHTDCLVVGGLAIGSPRQGLDHVIEGLKTGPWVVAQLEQDDDAYYESDKSAEGSNAGGEVVKLVLQHSHIVEDDLQAVPWDDLFSFTTRTGVWFVYSLCELERIAAESADFGEALGCVADWVIESENRMPGGIVVHEMELDAGFKVLGKKVDGLWVQLKVIG
ncbi:hypothetical protein PUNSTDRAFT_128878 [Punctularia strigosozonata HHB-11173 SS5]|uniref:uncharacterized protein n=1 Tax=Punctularia strigosozonata (strain HHB-11173) TaxID=741275 RepID=UPI000441764D|nr:uncharacterized protein PUNSTDRAFT_128878 [Punctularia strigosozonata HHB-11173 SS5]EIN13189.1 hypothetical protein PUNSTDRAFT_128878 [Punctularia strigosozonata HHB-11173 SS5]